MFRPVVRTAAVLVAFLAALLVGHGQAMAEQGSDDPTISEKEKRFVLGLGWTYARFSTTFERIDEDSGARAYISLEGDLGLPATENVPFASLLARIGKKDYIAANLGRFRRTNTLLSLDETLHLDDLVIEVDADVELFFDVNDIDVAYGHAYLDDERVRIIGKFGLSLLDLDLGLYAEGDYSTGDVSGSGSYEIAASLLVPVPLIGVIFDVDLAGGWSLSSSVDFFYLPIGDIKAEAWRTRIHLRYRFNRTVSVIFGYGNFDIEVVEKTDDAKSTIAYDMGGFSAGLTFTF